MARPGPDRPGVVGLYGNVTFYNGKKWTGFNFFRSIYKMNLKNAHLSNLNKNGCIATRIYNCTHQPSNDSYRLKLSCFFLFVFLWIFRLYANASDLVCGVLGIGDLLVFFLKQIGFLIFLSDYSNILKDIFEKNRKIITMYECLWWVSLDARNYK